MTEVERTAHFPVPATELWEALTDAALLAEWFGADEIGGAKSGAVAIDLRPGGTMRFGDGDGDGGDRDVARTRTAVVEEVEPGRRLTFTWSDDEEGAPGSRVEIDVIELDDGESELRVREALVDDLGDLSDFVDFDVVEIEAEPFPIGFQPPRALARA